jgi:hypothetical protein
MRDWTHYFGFAFVPPQERVSTPDPTFDQIIQKTLIIMIRASTTLAI